MVSNPQNLSNSSISNSFFFRPTNNFEVNKIIMSLKNKPSNIKTYSVKILKYISSIISPILARLINISISTGHFPASFKIARVVPIFKSGDKNNVNNYRPISILPIFSKIFEKIVCNQLYNYFELFKLFNPSQFGFRKKVSTSNAITNTLQYIYDHLDQGDSVVSIFLDFSKAFDCVNHKILLEKMSMYGVRGVASRWFQSYLSGRRQYVSLNNATSELCSIDRGVPQGSILGPLLFLIFINDFPKCSDFFNFTLFADDSTLTCKFQNTSPEQITSLIENNLSLINTWTNKNRIKINNEKSNIIAFSYRKNIQLGRIKLGTSFINQINCTKFLGLYIDSNLSFKNHIDYILSKISKSVGILYRLSLYLPPDILKILYNSLILPYLSYGIESWHGAPRYMSGRVQIMQKKAIRAIYGLSYNSHTNQHFKMNNILKLTDLYNLNLCSHVFKYLQLPNNTLQFRPHSLIHEHNTRHRANLITPRYNRTHTQSSFMYTSITEWNKIPHFIKNTDCIHKFKKELKRYYCGLY